MLVCKGEAILRGLLRALVLQGVVERHHSAIEGLELRWSGPWDGAANDVCRVLDSGDIRKGKVQAVILAANDKVVVSRRKF